MWVWGQEWGRAEGEALAGLDREPGVLDCGGGVTREVAASSEAGPERHVGEPLKTSLPLAVGHDVLIEAQLASWADDSVNLGKRGVLVGYGAEHKRNDPGVKRSGLARKTIGATVEDGDWDRRAASGKPCTFTQVALGLDGHDLVDRGRVVGEVCAATGTDLDHPTPQPREQLAAMLCAATLFARLCDLRIDAGEEWMRCAFRHCQDIIPQRVPTPKPAGSPSPCPPP